MRAPDEVARPRVLIRPWVLLLLAEAPGHGYELVQRLRRLGFRWESRGGPIYRELRLMAEAGLVRATATEPDSGPMRNVYDLTPQGRAELCRMAEAAGQLSGLSMQYVARHRAVERRLQAR